MAGLRQLAHPVEHFEITVDVSRVVNQVLGQITGDAEFGKDDHIAFLAARYLYPATNRFEIPGKVAGCGVYLAKADFHALTGVRFGIVT